MNYNVKALLRYLFLIPFLLFLFVWVYVLLIEMDSFQISIFDYGVAYNLVWREAFGVSSLPSSVGYLPYLYSTKLISFVLVPYVFLFPSIYDLLVMQVIVIALPSIILYLFSMKLTNKVSISLTMEILWLLYYPNSAVINYPFHYQTIFPLFYLCGFILFYLKRLRLSLISFSFASITNLLAPFIIVFTIFTLFLQIKKMKSHYSDISSKTFILFSTGVIIVAFSIVLLNLYTGGLNLFREEAVPSTSTSQNLPLFDMLLNKFLYLSGFPGFLYILFMIFPLIFSIFLESEFILASIPSILYYLVGYSGGYLRYFYPMQYSVWISPIVFLSFIFLIKRIQDGDFAQGLELLKRFKIKMHIQKLSRNKVNAVLIVGALLINVGLFAVYSPIGPLNQFLKESPNANPPANGGYGLYNNLTITSYDKNLLKMESLVPQNATVLSQFNMPQFSNRYYFTFPGQYDPAQPIDYAINDPSNAFWFTTSVDDTGSNFYNLNMMQLSNMFLENNSYGVYAQSEGAILSRHNYTGNPVFYVPLNESIPLEPNKAGQSSSRETLMIPGIYNINVTLVNSSNSSLYLGGLDLGNLKGGKLNTTLNVALYSYSFFYVDGTNCSGSVSINQIGYASNIITNLVNSTPVKHKKIDSNYANPPLTTINLLHIITKSCSYTSVFNLPSIGIDSNILEIQAMIFTYLPQTKLYGIRL